MRVWHVDRLVETAGVCGESVNVCVGRVGISESTQCGPVANNAQPFEGSPLAPRKERARDCTPESVSVAPVAQPRSLFAGQQF